MKLGLALGYSGKRLNIPIDHIRHAENLGYDSVWTAEAYGSDAVSPAAWILAQTEKIHVGTAIMQMPARSPAMAAMTAITLSDGHAPEGIHQHHASGIFMPTAADPGRAAIPDPLYRRWGNWPRKTLEEHPENRSQNSYFCGQHYP